MTSLKGERYSLTLHLRHVAQRLADALAWHDANGHFKAERERIAFTAGYEEGVRAARGLIDMHGPVTEYTGFVAPYPINGV